MKLSKKLFSLLLGSFLLLSMAAGCNNSADTPTDSSTATTAETAIVSPETSSDVQSITETDAPEPEPEPEDSLSWVVEPGKFNGDIQPVFNFGGSAVEIGLSVLNDKYLIDYEGNTRYTFPNEKCYNGQACVFCTLCGVVDFGNNSHLSSDTYEVLPRIGHGLEGVNTLYLYDAATGDIGYYNYGDFILVSENIPYRVVALAEKDTAGGDNPFPGEVLYENKGLYGIVIDSKLAVPFEYDSYINYSNGITALRKDGKWAYFNAEGEMILQNLYSPSAIKQNDEAIPYSASAGYIALNLDGKWGFADTDGNIVTDFIFEEARPVFFGMAWVKTDAGWGVVKIEDCRIITEDEAKATIKSDAEEMFSSSGLTSITITRTEKKFYEYKGLSFACTAVLSNGTTYTYDAIVSYDGSIICRDNMTYS